MPVTESNRSLLAPAQVAADMVGTSVARAAGILAPEMGVLCARWHAVRPCPRLWWQLVSAFLRGGLMLFTVLAGMGPR